MPIIKLADEQTINVPTYDFAVLYNLTSTRAFLIDEKRKVVWSGALMPLKRQIHLWETINPEAHIVNGVVLEGFFIPEKCWMEKPTPMDATMGAIKIGGGAPPKPAKYTKDTKIGDIIKYKNLSDYKGLKGKIPVRAETTYVGVEIELEQVKVKNLDASSWKQTDDGSLKVEGKEFVTIPIQVKYLEVELERLFKGLAKCAVSSRCSVHVHLNARDFTLEELKSFVMLYMVFEKSLYNVSGNRWNSLFCVPLHMSPYIVRNYFRSLTDNNILPTSGWYKYFGLNISPLYGGESRPLGTVEFRQMEGTKDIKRILNWINLIVSLKITAKKIPHEELVKMLLAMNTTSEYKDLTETTFKEYGEQLLRQPTYKEDIESCITQAKMVFLQDPINF